MEKNEQRDDNSQPRLKVSGRSQGSSDGISRAAYYVLMATIALLLTGLVCTGVEIVGLRAENKVLKATQQNWSAQQPASPTILPKVAPSPRVEPEPQPEVIVEQEQKPAANKAYLNSLDKEGLLKIAAKIFGHGLETRVFYAPKAKAAYKATAKLEEDALRSRIILLLAMQARYLENRAARGEKWNGLKKRCASSKTSICKMEWHTRKYGINNKEINARIVALEAETKNLKKPLDLHQWLKHEYIIFLLTPTDNTSGEKGTGGNNTQSFPA